MEKNLGGWNDLKSRWLWYIKHFLKKYTTTNTDKNCPQWSNLLVLYIVLSINFLLSTRQSCKISTIPILNTEKLNFKDHKWLPKATQQVSAGVKIKTIFVCEENKDIPDGTSNTFSKPKLEWWKIICFNYTIFIFHDSIIWFSQIEGLYSYSPQPLP